jgi:hypothetical protein
MGSWRHGAFLGVRASGQAAIRDPAMQQARTKILAACKANKKFFLNTFGPTDVIDMIKEGVMIGPSSRETAEIGRKIHEACDAVVTLRSIDRECTADLPAHRYGWEVPPE